MAPHADTGLDALRANLERVGIRGPQLDQALAEIRDSLWLAAHDAAVAARALRDFADLFMGETPGLLLDAATCRDLDLLARERAADIEGGAS